MIRFTETAPFVAIEYSYEVERVLYRKKSKYQDIMVFENPHFGRMLVLDGIVQLTERDEHRAGGVKAQERGEVLLHRDRPRGDRGKQGVFPYRGVLN
jgi:spermidine synthase